MTYSGVMVSVCQFEGVNTKVSIVSGIRASGVSVNVFHTTGSISSSVRRISYYIVHTQFAARTGHSCADSSTVDS